MSHLQVKNVTYTYKNGPTVLKGIDVNFEAGKIYALIGPSGSGKTTLLSLIGGLDVPTTGQITREGESIDANGLLHYRKHHISFVFQQFNLLDYLTASENVQLTSNKDPLAMLAKVGLSSEQAGRSVLKLSGGQQQRVAIARALLSDAKVLLADEPTGNLDEETAGDIVELLRQSAHEMGKCVIVVTHSNELAQRCDVVYKMKQGVLEKVKDQHEVGEGDELLSESS